MLDHSSDSGRLSPDSLSDALQDLRLSGASYGRVELGAPWGIAFPPQNGANLHFVVEGQCWLLTNTDAPMLLEHNDAVLLPHGLGHVLADVADGQTTALAELPRQRLGDHTFRLRVGGNGARSLLVCCTVGFDDPSVHPLLELMPDRLLLRNELAEDPALPMLLETLAAEASAQRIGAAVVMSRLADVLIVRTIRAWAEAHMGETTGWFAAMQDPQIGRALAAIHRKPGDSQSVETLANIANLSRSRFSERFAAVVGMPPPRYVARWRMNLASAWLRNDRLSISEVAARLGYDSEASFSRAFKREVGTPPSAIRTSNPRMPE